MSELCFFTMSNLKQITWARRLVSSGDVADRPIWFYRIPQDHPDPKRYKIELLMGDLLPEAEKYIYLDADTFMLQHGDWESSVCVGAAIENFKKGIKGYFTDAVGYNAYCKLFEEHGRPVRVNTGVVVLPADIRKQVAQQWMEWCYKIDTLCEKPTPVRDQMHFAFVRKELNLPFLPSRFNTMIKMEEVLSDSVLIHAAGKPHGSAVERYHKAVNEILGGYIESVPKDILGYRWQVITDLIIRYAENPTYPVGVEVGVDIGENAGHLLRAFPGLKLYCIDNWSRGEKRYIAWSGVKNEFSGRVVEYKGLSDSVTVGELLDFVFIDADHRTEQVVKDINHWLPQVKVGGVIIGHDINHKSKTGSVQSVGAAVETVFGTDYKTGADFTWWVRKK